VSEAPHASQRFTTSSRRPGAVIHGTVHTRAASIVPCPSCGGLRKDYGGPHAARWERGRLVDCVGRPV
jgi:hypothetical protein